MKKVFTINLIEEIAPLIGARVELEETYQMIGRILFKNGSTTFFRKGNFGINSFGSAALVKDKGYTAHYLRQFSYPTPPSCTFFNDVINANVEAKRTLEDGLTYAQQLGFPVFVKPNDGSQGHLVGKVHNEKEYRALAQAILAEYLVLQVQAFVPGNDFRLTVLDGEVKIAYQRSPFFIVGDGENSVSVLIQKQLQAFEQQQRKVKIQANDERITEKLFQQGLTYESILFEGQQILLLNNANLSTGGIGIDYTDSVHPSFKSICHRVSKDFNLYMFGLDIIASDIRQAANTQKWNVIEINSSPSLYHFSKIGPLQLERTKHFYTELLLFIEKMQDNGQINTSFI